MRRNSIPPPSARELRQIAEERHRLQRSQLDQGRTDADIPHLVHELEVHQIELEMQNEELMAMRDRLEEELEKYSDLYDFAPVGYLTLDRAGTIQESNLAAASLLGIERSSLVGRRFGLLVAPEERQVFASLLTRVFAGRSKESCEVTMRKKEAPQMTLRLEAATTSSAEACRAIVTDVTERNRAELDRLVLGKLQSTGILAGGIAHDFNNLLTVVLLDIDRAQALASSAEGLESFLDEAKKAALSARSLTRQLITFSTGGTPVRKPDHLFDLIRESVRPPLSGSRVRCELSLADELWPADVDAGQIGQVISNLVLNAREAMPEGGVVTVRGENVVLREHEIPGSTPGEHVRITVADRGCGISKEALSKVFDPYYSTKRRGGQRGMGLGLTICKTIVQKHGGVLTVDSEAGVGTAFQLYLPAFRGPVREAAPPVRARPVRPGNILVMDDEESMRRVTGATLRRLGHGVVLVGDGREAVVAYTTAREQGSPFDLVILDLTVRDGMGGMESIKELRRIDPAVKAIAISGYSDNPVILDPAHYGFTDAMAKPFDLAKLQEVISRVLVR